MENRCRNKGKTVTKVSPPCKNEQIDPFMNAKKQYEWTGNNELSTELQKWLSEFLTAERTIDLDLFPRRVTCDGRKADLEFLKD